MPVCQTSGTSRVSFLERFRGNRVEIQAGFDRSISTWPNRLDPCLVGTYAKSNNFLWSKIVLWTRVNPRNRRMKLSNILHGWRLRFGVVFTCFVPFAISNNRGNRKGRADYSWNIFGPGCTWIYPWTGKTILRIYGETGTIERLFRRFHCDVLCVDMYFWHYCKVRERTWGKGGAEWVSTRFPIFDARLGNF